MSSLTNSHMIVDSGVLIDWNIVCELCLLQHYACHLHTTTPVIQR